MIVWGSLMSPSNKGGWLGVLACCHPTEDDGWLLSTALNKESLDFSRLLSAEGGSAYSSIVQFSCAQDKIIFPVNQLSTYVSPDREPLQI